MAKLHEEWFKHTRSGWGSSDHVFWTVGIKILQLEREMKKPCKTMCQREYSREYSKFVKEIKWWKTLGLFPIFGSKGFFFFFKPFLLTLWLLWIMDISKYWFVLFFFFSLLFFFFFWPFFPIEHLGVSRSLDEAVKLVCRWQKMTAQSFSTTISFSPKNM